MSKMCWHLLNKNALRGNLLNKFNDYPDIKDKILTTLHLSAEAESALQNKMR